MTNKVILGGANMPYMICDNCKKTYKIKSIHDKPSICECGGTLRYDKTIKQKSISQILNESEKIKDLIEKSNPESYQIIKDYESTIAKVILYTILNITLQITRERLIKILTGRQDTYIIDSKLNEFVTYSLFNGNDKIYLEKIIHELITNEYLNETPEKILMITQRGKQFLNSNYELPKIVFTNEASYITQNDRELFHKLRKLRNEIAIENNFPPYIICNNDTLLSIALKKPEDEDSLILIKGVGNKFINEYGSAFLELVHQYT